MGNVNGTATVGKIVTLGGKRHSHKESTKPHKIKPRRSKSKTLAASEDTKSALQQGANINDRDDKSSKQRTESNTEDIKDISKSTLTPSLNTNNQNDTNVIAKPNMQSLYCANKPKQTDMKTMETVEKRDKQPSLKTSDEMKKPKMNKKMPRILNCQSSSTDFASSFSNLSLKRLLRPKQKDRKVERDWEREEMRIRMEYEKAETQIRNSVMDEQRAKAQAQSWRSRLEKLTTEHRDRLFKQADSLHSRLRQAEKLLTYHEARAKRLHDKNSQMKDLINSVKEEARSLRVEGEKKRVASQRKFEEKFSAMEQQLVKLREKIKEANLKELSKGSMFSHKSKRQLPTEKSNQVAFVASLRPDHFQQNQPGRKINCATSPRCGSYSRYSNLPPSTYYPKTIAPARSLLPAQAYTPSFYPPHHETTRTINRYTAYSDKNCRSFETDCFPAAVPAVRQPVQVAEHVTSTSPQRSSYLPTYTSQEYVVLSNPRKRFTPVVVKSPVPVKPVQIHESVPVLEDEFIKTSLPLPSTGVPLKRFAHHSSSTGSKRCDFSPPSRYTNFSNTSRRSHAHAELFNRNSGCFHCSCSGHESAASEPLRPVTMVFHNQAYSKQRKCNSSSIPNCKTSTRQSRPTSILKPSAPIYEADHGIPTDCAKRLKTRTTRRRPGCTQSTLLSSPGDANTLTSDDDLLKDVGSSYSALTSSVGSGTTRQSTRGIESSLVSPNSVKLVNDCEDVTSLYNDVIKRDLETLSSNESKKKMVNAGEGAFVTPGSSRNSDQNGLRQVKIRSEPTSPYDIISKKKKPSLRSRNQGYRISTK
ncbi:uncharacterized protein LOC143469618 isoform X1 [Clavelina lepadiformis]|uniref:uncharacterized protein LOC143469618 isoform X1 n=1 Tax=Clavelina lepadiformis TaxID=159417 RepID=UPI0040413B1E